MSVGFEGKLLGKTASAVARPYGGLRIQGDASIGAALYARLRFVGHIMQLSFPTRAEIEFSKFPLDVK